MSDYVTGKHPARAVGAVVGQAGTGTEQVAVEYEFTEGQNQGKHITWFGFFTDGAFDRTIESLRISGWTGDMLDDLSSLSGPETPTVQLVLEQEDYNGKPQVKVRWVNKLGGLAMKGAFGAVESKSFAERMKARVQASDRARSAGTGAPRPTPRPTAPTSQQQAQSDDIPF